MANDKVTVSAQIDPELLETLKKLAQSRRIDANTVLEQAIQTESFFADQLGSGSKVLIEQPDKSLRVVRFDRSL